MCPKVVSRLEAFDIQPSAQRVAVAEYVLFTDAHPTADQVFQTVKKTFPLISRATVYNTLNLFVSKGLVRELTLSEGRVVFDANTDLHHHFIDETSGEIYDIPWGSLEVKQRAPLEGFDVHTYQVVVRGQKIHRS